MPRRTKEKQTTRRTQRRVEAAEGGCLFCREKKTPDFLEYDTLSRFTSERGKIISRTRSGVCSKHQRRLTQAIKRARYLAFLPYVVRPD